MLEKTIADLIERKNAAPEGSAAYRLVLRELAGLRYTYEEAGPIMEDLDPLELGATSPIPRVSDPEGPAQVLPLQHTQRRADCSSTFTNYASRHYDVCQ